MTMLRTFIAIELDQELRENLGSLQDQLRKRMAPGTVRWVQPAGIHLTLKFLGNTPVEQVDRVKAALAKASSRVNPFRFTVEGLGCFPNVRRPRVVWVAVDEPTGALLRLRDAVEEYVAPLGFPTERRSFHPHLTLGRVQRRASKSEVREIGEVVATSDAGLVGTMSISVVSYIKSDLRPTGAVYTPLLGAELGGA